MNTDMLNTDMLAETTAGPLSGSATARTISPWVRARLARVHRRPSPRLALSPVDWRTEDEPVREWLLAPDPAVCGRVESEVQEWALRRGLYQSSAKSALVEGPCTMLACAVMPDAPAELVRLTSMYWTLIIAFDDQVVEAGQSPEPYLHAIPEILLHGRLPASPDAFHTAFADVAAGIRALRGDELLPEFTHWVAEAVASYVREWQRTAEGRLPGLDEYLHDAIANSHILPGMLLQRLQPGLVAPGTRLPVDLDHLARLVTQIARLENDLLSFAKDERDGAVNVCRILARDHAASPIQAVPTVLGMINALRAAHDDLLAAITRDPALGDVHRQAVTIGDWVDACYAWFLTVARYGVAHRPST
jgi:hypothetical protein